MIAEMILEDCLPLELVNKSGFRKFIEAVCPYLEIPSTRQIQRELDEITKDESQLLKDQIENECKFAHVTADGWTSKANERYTGVTLHYITDNFQLRSKCIGVKYHEEATGALGSEATAKYIKDASVECGVKKSNRSVRTGATL
jgi:hypothetical protein